MTPIQRLDLALLTWDAWEARQEHRMESWKGRTRVEHAHHVSEQRIEDGLMVVLTGEAPQTIEGVMALYRECDPGADHVHVRMGLLRLMRAGRVIVHRGESVLYEARY